MNEAARQVKKNMIVSGEQTTGKILELITKLGEKLIQIR